MWCVGSMVLSGMYVCTVYFKCAEMSQMSLRTAQSWVVELG